MPEIESAEIVVLGGGPAGLSVAWSLVEHGKSVIILEKEPVCGGQSITFQRGNYRYDLGPHNIHSHRKSIIGFLQNAIGNNFGKHDFFSEIYFQRKRIRYPLDGIDILRSISVLTALGCGFSFILSRMMSFFIPAFRDDGSYKRWIINRFGKRFYDIFFGPYSEKVWGIPGEEISQIVAEKRVTTKGVIELLHSMIFKKEKYHPENPRVVECYYPKSGVGEISDFFVNEIGEQGGSIVTNASVEKIMLDGSKHVSEIIYSEKGVEKKIRLMKSKNGVNGQVLSSIPLNELILMLQGDVPKPVVESARRLDFTAEIFLYLDVNRKDVFELPLLYFSEREFPFNRIYDVGVFSRDMVPVGRNALCLEVSCSEGDQWWEMDDKALFRKCIEPLERHGLLNRSDVDDYFTRHLKHAYPRFRIGYETNVIEIIDYVQNDLSNVMTFGRQGLFSYANIDDVIWMGFQAAMHIMFKRQVNLSLEELLPEYVASERRDV